MSLKLASRDPIPITLLSGFLGAGKTTLLEHILTSNHGLKIAVVINDMASVNIDAELISNHKVTTVKEQLIQLQNGCICCTLRGDLLEELASLAKDDQFQYIVIESSGASEPMLIAETFTHEYSEMLKQLYTDLQKSHENNEIVGNVVKLGGLSAIATIDTCVTVVDAFNFISNFETVEFARDANGDVPEKTLSDLMVDQLEFANVIIINKASAVNFETQYKIREVINSLNPSARIISADYCQIDVSQILNTKMFDFHQAMHSSGWLKSFEEEIERRKAPPIRHESELEYGLNNFVYVSKRPFHPVRLYNFLVDKFILIEDSFIHENDPNSIIIKKRNSVFGSVVRSKGFFWLATRFLMKGEWSCAGSMLTLKNGNPWFSIMGQYDAKEDIYNNGDLISRLFADRRQEIVFIGLFMNKNAIIQELDKCLVNDRELMAIEKIVFEASSYMEIENNLQLLFEDPFEEWGIHFGSGPVDVEYEEEEDLMDEEMDVQT